MPNSSIKTARKAKNSILDDLSAEARKWKDRKLSMEYDDDPEFWWEVKARMVLLGEAWDLVNSIDVSDLKTREDFHSRLLHDMLNHKDWGWGGNWSDKIHSE
ncbi:MAG: hypothetical protein GYA56_10895, partial [Geobacteraceae bacterium]|nr:hypothetical protein [Geobacteraceae bacterium]